MDLLAALPEELAVRDVVVITDTDPAAMSSTRTALRPRGFMLALIAKDGTVNLRKPFPWDVRELTRAIEIDPARPVPAIIAAGDRTERGYWKADEDAETPAARLEIYAASPVFDAMSGADTIGILAEGQPALIVPGDPQLDQQVKACRNDSPGTP